MMLFPFAILMTLFIISLMSGNINMAIIFGGMILAGIIGAILGFLSNIFNRNK